MSVIAVIPARGGSKGLKKKNIADFCGQPMLAYTVKAALKCAFIDKVFVSTEDREIQIRALTAGATVIPRPQELATDEATTAQVVEHAIHYSHDYYGIYADTYIMLQPTSPLRTAQDIEEAYALYDQEPLAMSVIAVCEASSHPWKVLVKDSAGRLTPLFGRESLNVARQTLPQCYVQTGGIYIGNTSAFLREKDLYLEPMIPYFTTREKGIDIDTAMELRMAEAVYREHHK